MHPNPKIRRTRGLRAAFLTIALAFPMLGADGCDITGTEEDESSSYDGSYNLVAVDGQSLPYNMIYVDSRNRLVLTRGTWTLSGNTLRTEMYTTSVVNGVSTTETRFNPERHTGTVTISGGRATGTLDTGSSVSTTISSGTMLTTYNGHQMKFEKN